MQNIIIKSSEITSLLKIPYFSADDKVVNNLSINEEKLNKDCAEVNYGNFKIVF